MTPRALILVADDDDAMREMVAASLRRQELEVDECTDGAELLRQLHLAQQGSRVPDVVVTDIQMPGATGLDVVFWLKRWLPQVPCILITAFGDSLTHRRARELGAARLIDKPFDLSELHGEILKLLEQRGDGSAHGDLTPQEPS